ncbi:MAG: choice-of-anchor D domain-containing protein, partial [Armatimonadetes bacterium]|nr:choice-of-anchor D domain-containing protein [Armatimonadota bacterium]
MTLSQPGSLENIQADIRGEISGQVAVGSHIVQIGSVHGGVVNIAAADQLPAVRPRPAPVLLRPRAFPGLLDREAELHTASSAMESGGPVEFHGGAGIGKTVLLRHLAHRPLPAGFPDGIVYLHVRRQPVPDLVQALFDAFYESGAPLKPTDTQSRHALQDTRALILLDDVEVPREDVEALMDAVPASTFLLASPERRLWGEVRAVAMRGLPLEAARALMERELDRSLAADEIPAAEALWTALQGHPLGLVQAAAAARAEGRSLAAVSEAVRPGSPEQAVPAMVLAGLGEAELRVVAALAAVGGGPLRADHLGALTGIPNIEPVLEGLLARRVVQAHSPRYSLTAPFLELVRRTQDLDPWRERALRLFADLAEQHRTDAAGLLEDSDAVAATVEWALAAGRPGDALRLGRAVDTALALGLRWGLWGRVLEWSVEAARACGALSGEAWALHQLGTRALCLGDAATAQPALVEALRLREALGDSIGAAVTRHNLDILWGAPPPSRGSDTPPSPPGPTPPPPVLLGVRALVLLALPVLVAGALATRHLWLRPAVGLVPSRVDFGAIEIGSGGDPRTVTLTNTGSAALTIHGVTLAGTHPADFTAVTDGCSRTTVAPRGSCAVSFAFRPTGAGGRTATLTISSTARDSPHRIGLSGEGTPIPPAALRLEPGLVDFGPQETGAGGAPRTLSVINRGPGAVTILRVSLDGAHAGEFAAVSDQCSGATLAAGATCTVGIRFLPRDSGDRRAAVSVTSSARDSPVRADLRGVATLPPPRAGVSAARLDFGSHDVRAGGAARTLTVTNLGASPLIMR